MFMCAVTMTYIQSSTWICCGLGTNQVMMQYGIKIGDTRKWRKQPYTAKPNINTNRALNHVDKLGLAELALAEVTCSVYHDVSVGRCSPSDKREGCGV